MKTENKKIILSLKQQKQVLEEIFKQTDLIIKEKKYTVTEETKLVDMSSIRRQIEQSNKPLTYTSDNSNYDTLKWILSKTRKNK